MASIIILGAAIVHFLKHYLARPRPLQEFGSDVNIIYEKVYANSFPSGHTELAFSLCVFMFIMVKKYWYIYIFFALASGFYRIYAGNHYPSDILGGAAIGIFCAYAVIYLFKKYKNFK
ncbi:MAG: phosphatase PAP2 family protein [Endomicrobium sp.]|nr:phosphatase PAP2 family protein [Endomicrobium sp.]